MRHSLARRSMLSAIGARVRLADQVRDRPKHSGPLAQAPVSGPHRILRLAMAVGLAGAGFCLVLAMIGLVVAIGDSHSPKAALHRAGHQGRATADQGNSTLTIPGKPGTARLHWRPSANVKHDGAGRAGRAGSASPLLVGATVERFQGRGSPRRHRFKVARPGDWGVSWKFSCPAIRAGRFALSETDGKVTNDIELSASDTREHGISWHLNDPGSHSLTILSNCAWVVQIVLPRA
jgi:hypothetical protein